MTVITCVPNCPDGIAFDGYKNRLRRQVETVEGIKVVRVWTHLAPNAGFTRRTLNYLSYQFSAVLASLRLEKPDVVIATSPQFFCGWAGVWASRLKRTRFVLEIRDIWPESIAAVGAVKKGFLIKYLEWLEKRMYQAADAIVCVGDGYRDKVLEKAPDMADRTTVITNGVDAERFIPAEKDRDFLRQFGIENQFVCSYVGTIGMAHGLDVVIRAAQLIKKRDRNDIRFLIVGDGAFREKLTQMAAAGSVADLVVFTGRLPKDEMPRVLSSSDCYLVHLKGTDLFETVIPSKIFEMMAMQRSIIMGVKGPARDIVMSARGGQPMEPDNENELCDLVCKMADDARETAAQGENARAYVLEHFNRDTLAKDYLEFLERKV